MISAGLQPDQEPLRWDDHVLVYERIFEPFSTDFAAVAIASLGLTRGARCLDVGCGSGGAALRLAAAGVYVDAIDASEGMVARTRLRSAEKGASDFIQATVMDGQALRFPDRSFDAALSVFGVILFPDAARGLAEMRRVVKPGGTIAVVTWTEPQNFELAAELRAAIADLAPGQPAAPLPAQLRFRERADFEALHQAAGLSDVYIERHTAAIHAPSARWLTDHMAFAPGMAAMLRQLGGHAPAVLARFVERLETRQGSGSITLNGTAFVGISRVP